MRLGWGMGLVLGGMLALAQYVHGMERRIELAARLGWAQVCWHAPHRTLTPEVLTGLREAQIAVGAHGWQPSVAWVNEQCQVLGSTPVRL